MVRVRSPNVVYTFNENDTLTLSAPFCEVSINLKEIKDDVNERN